MPLESVQGSRVLKICLRGLDLEDERGMVRPRSARIQIWCL